MDKANSDYLYPNLMDLEGHPISIGLDKTTNRYQTRISRFEHVEGDSLFDCATYTVQNSFDKCIKKDLEKLFAKKLGCQPPYLSENLNNTCDKKFNVSLNKSKEISALFWHLRYRGIKFKCKAPCTKTSYRTRFAGTAPYAYTALYITFDSFKIQHRWPNIFDKIGRFHRRWPIFALGTCQPFGGTSGD